MAHIIMALIVTIWASVSCIGALIFFSLTLFKPKGTPRGLMALMALIFLSLFVLTQGVTY